MGNRIVFVWDDNSSNVNERRISIDGNWFGKHRVGIGTSSFGDDGVFFIARTSGFSAMDWNNFDCFGDYFDEYELG